MALTEDKVTDAQVALVTKLQPAAAALSADEIRALLAATTAQQPQRDPVTGETAMAAYGPITTEVVDTYQVLAELWWQEGVRIAALPEQPRRVRSESNGDTARSYDGGGPMSADQAFGLSRRMRAKAIDPGRGGARTVDVLPPYSQRGFGSNLLDREVTYTDPAPVPTGAAYQVNRPEPPA